VTAPTGVCPNCGAELNFRWAGSIQTTCPACKSILVKEGANLKDVGKKTDVPLSMSRIQLGTEGKYKGKNFIVIGRIVYKFGRGHWSEWHIRLGEQSYWLSDAQGDYVVTKQSDASKIDAPLDHLSPGDTIITGDKELSVATITNAMYVGVEGELPFEYWDKSENTFVDFKFGSNGFATLDYSENPPLFFLGEYQSFEELKFTNLRRRGTAEYTAMTKTKGINCVSCGAAIELKLGLMTATVACVACGQIMDASDPNSDMVRAVMQQRSIEPTTIPLGSEALLKGVKWIAIGYQKRSITVEGIDYAWDEYLLWNADKGFRYLSEYEGHWNDITTIKGAPAQKTAGAQPVMHYLDRDFKHFQSAIATTQIALGEFPWEVRVGDRVVSDDFVSPPLLLSREKTAEEVTWSLGTYTDPERIRQWFKLKEPLRKPSGVFANQPNPRAGRVGSYFSVFFILLILLGVAFFARHGLASKQRVFADNYRSNITTPAFVTPIFDIPKNKGNVEITIDTDLDQDWKFFNIALLQESGGRGFEIGREVGYYHGFEDGESWSEGSRSDRAIIASVPGGKYYLRVDTEGGAGGNFNYGITVRRDVPRYFPFIAAFVLLIVPPLLVWGMHQSFETKRWAESDHAPVEEDDDEE
jgi:hypothetical protein